MKTITLIDKLTDENKQESEKKIAPKLPPGLVKVHVFLYQLTEKILNIWYNYLKPLPKYGITVLFILRRACSRISSLQIPTCKNMLRGYCH